MESSSEREKCPNESSSKSSFTPQVRAAMRSFLNEVDRKDSHEMAESLKKINTMDDLCSKYKEHVKEKRSGEQSGSKAAKRGKHEKEDAKMFGVRRACTPPIKQF